MLGAAIISTILPLLSYLAFPFAASASTLPECKATPGTASWPSAAEWDALKSTVSGQLIQPSPPGAVCHTNQPTYNAAVCPKLQKEWQSIFFHQDDPISTPWNNLNNDSCLPIASAPCSGEGYPVYVVNATTPAHVQAAVQFAGQHGVRLVVKATGHDYLGRSIAPNSLSIWTHHMKSLSIHESFKPKSCSNTIDTPAITLGAGSQMNEINIAAHKANLTILSGGSQTVGVCGHSSGGGHSALSPAYGLGADSVLEIDLVTPTGEMITANECQHQDLFWALRGGGGSTFGVVTSITIAAFHSKPFLTVNFQMGAKLDSDAYWNAVAYMVSQYPLLSDLGFSAYSFVSPNTTVKGKTLSGYSAAFSMPKLSEQNTTASMMAALKPIVNHINTTYSGQIELSVDAEAYPTFYDWWKVSNGPNDAGADIQLGSRLLDRKALTANVTKLRDAIRTATPFNIGTQLFLVGGKGVRDAMPRGGGDAVTPAWRESLVHMIIVVGWPALNETAKHEAQDALADIYVQALEDLAPDTGAYINESNPKQKNPYETFWGAHYPRLLKIKRRVDPNDVLWCTPCVGNERWKEVGNQLCRA